MRVHGEIGYTSGEKFSALGGITLNRYAGLDVYDKAFGLIPTEINAAIRYVAIKDLLLKADAYFWDGATYSTKTISSGKLDPAFDLNLGAEFSFLPQWKAWLQFNNVFNNKYERWKQYPVLGFNMLIGVVYSFGDIKAK